MPRIANEGPAVDVWYNIAGNGNGSSTFDLCRHCFNRHGGDGGTLPTDLEPYGRYGYNYEPRGIMMQMNGADVYGDDSYRCELCNVQLSPRNY